MNENDTSASPLLSKLPWPSIDEVINGGTTNIVYKSINSHVTIYLCSLFSNLYVPYMNTENVEKSFSYCGARLWNGLKPASKNAPSIFAFKRAIK